MAEEWNESQWRYETSDKGKERQAKYNASDKGRNTGNETGHPTVNGKTLKKIIQKTLATKQHKE